MMEPEPQVIAATAMTTGSGSAQDLKMEKEPQSAASTPSRISKHNAHKQCDYEGCGRTNHTFVQVREGCEAGGKDWSELVGKTLCKQCYTQYFICGTLQRTESDMFAQVQHQWDTRMKTLSHMLATLMDEKRLPEKSQRKVWALVQNVCRLSIDFPKKLTRNHDVSEVSSTSDPGDADAPPQPGPNVQGDANAPAHADPNVQGDANDPPPTWPQRPR